MLAGNVKYLASSVSHKNLAFGGGGWSVMIWWWNSWSWNNNFFEAATFLGRVQYLWVGVIDGDEDGGVMCLWTVICSDDSEIPSLTVGDNGIAVLVAPVNKLGAVEIFCSNFRAAGIVVSVLEELLVVLAGLQTKKRQYYKYIRIKIINKQKFFSNFSLTQFCQLS